MTTAPALQVQGLSKAYGSARAVDDLTFSVRHGAVTGFIGPNGAGKTTTLRMLLGLVRPSAGTALVTGRPYGELAQPARTVGAMLDVEQFHPGRSARAALRAITAAAGLPDARVDQVLAEVDLTAAAGKRVGGFSLGMRQRLGIAAALLGDPQVLVLDEPANGLDPAGVRWLRRLLRAWADGGRTALVSSHQLSELAHVADDLVVVDRGRLVAAGTAAEVTGGRDLEDVFFELTETEVAR